ncbi:hypothetical protein NDK47_14725 [Brevibacillus ruminantium]|uniref:DUF3846 domain-containing protein n=1 Tax=Brevibacillus ruminantium TaxID=2950604 RepID=A0ABY4W8C5_9BACL|nr:hypothetical protein [Brevibacillus ruminantium]USG63432.1 hypothetical protein NDK47_14725 [Brevibacillus ruminantium]
MITVMVKRPHEEAFALQVNNIDDVKELVGGDYELLTDDRLDGISLLVNEELRGIEANNFPITTDGYRDWVYGPCVFVLANGTSLTEADMEKVNQYLASQL